MSKNKFLFLIGGSLSVKNQFLTKILHTFRIKKNFSKIYLSFRNKKYKNVKLMNSITNLDKFYQRLDLMCFPSRMNALGRPVIEAASYGIPSLVCLKQYFNDTIINNKTGYVLKFGDQKSFIEKLYFLSKNKKKLIQLGMNAKKNYNIRHNLKNNTKKLCTLYRSLI